MLKINPRRTEYEAVWCEYDRDVRAKLKPIDKITMRRLRQEAALPARRSRQGQAEEIDETLFDHLVYRYVIEEWEGICDQDGRPLPCTGENIDIITDHIGSFAGWALEEAMALAEDYEDRLQDKLKNSSSSPDGSGGDPGASEAARPVK